MTDRKLRCRGLAVAAALAFSGCAAVGPDFTSPPAPRTEGYTSEPLPDETQSTGVSGGESQRFAYGKSLPAQWWTLFGSSRLNELIEEATANYPTLQAQQAALRQARYDLRAEQGALYPKVEAKLDRTRQKLSSAELSGATSGLPGVSGALPSIPGVISNIDSATVQVSYTFDFFGGERRAIEALGAQAEYQNFQVEASYLTLLSNLVTTALQAGAASDQIAATREIMDAQERQVSLIRRRFELGSITRADLMSAEAQLAATRATLPPLQQSLSQARHRLAVLTGRSPAEAAAAEFKLADFKLPLELPVSLPSSLVRQRADIRAQEALMHRASAQVGVATADMLPRVTLGVGYGSAASKPSDLFGPGSAVWSLAAGITQPIFQGGMLRAKRDAAVAAFDQAGAQYRQTVLTAFQNVADSLTALDNDAQALKAQHEAMTSAQASLEFAEKQYAAGAVAYVNVLTQQQQFQQARIDYLRALANRYQDTVTLFQALGGGWWERGTDAQAQALQAVPGSDAPRSAAQPK